MDYAKINELSDAIGYCQIFDACGCTIQLDKLNYAPGTKIPITSDIYLKRLDKNIPILNKKYHTKIIILY